MKKAAEPQPKPLTSDEKKKLARIFETLAKRK